MVDYFVSSLTGNYWLFALLQRYRYIQAYQVDLKLQSIEESFVSENRIGEEAMSRMRSQSHWRKELVVSYSSHLSLYMCIIILPHDACRIV